jgi:hypothetical protein
MGMGSTLPLWLCSRSPSSLPQHRSSVGSCRAGRARTSTTSGDAPSASWQKKPTSPVYKSRCSTETEPDVISTDPNSNPPHAHCLFLHFSLSVALPLSSRTPHRSRQAVHCQGIDQPSPANSAHLHPQHPPWHDRSHRLSNPLSPRVCRRRHASFRTAAAAAVGNAATIGRHSFSRRECECSSVLHTVRISGKAQRYCHRRARTEGSLKFTRT